MHDWPMADGPWPMAAQWRGAAQYDSRDINPTDSPSQRDRDEHGYRHVSITDSRWRRGCHDDVLLQWPLRHSVEVH